jgi:hypothetical protein
VLPWEKSFYRRKQSELRNNPYIQKISATTITYTKGFKERFEEEFRAGNLPSQILNGDYYASIFYDLMIIFS